MHNRFITTLVVAGLASVAACGGSGGGKQGEVADLFVDTMADEGVTVDRDCAGEAASKLSDDDAEKILDAGVDGDPDLSPEADAAAAEFVTCVDTDELVDQLVNQMIDEVGEENVDAECLRNALSGLDLTDIESNPDISAAMLDCVELG